MALASADTVLQTARCKFLVSKLFHFPARKITCPPVLLPKGKFARDASLQYFMIIFSMLPRFGNTITNGESLIFCNALFAFSKSATTGAFIVELSWQPSK